jgi:hypothetical protein
MTSHPLALRNQTSHGTGPHRVQGVEVAGAGAVAELVLAQVAAVHSAHYLIPLQAALASVQRREWTFLVAERPVSVLQRV